MNILDYLILRNKRGMMESKTNKMIPKRLEENRDMRDYPSQRENIELKRKIDKKERKKCQRRKRENLPKSEYNQVA